jgi:hypothetical protein
MQSMSENDFECLASTGVNTPPTAKMTDDGQGLSRWRGGRYRVGEPRDFRHG